MRQEQDTASSSSTEHARMAHHGHHHLRAARLEDLKDLCHSNRLQDSGQGAQLGSRKKSGSWTNSSLVNRALQLRACLITVAAMAWFRSTTALGFEHATTTSFSFEGNFSQNNFIVVQNASVAAEHIVLKSGSIGLAIYRTPVQLLVPGTDSVASFQTSFSFKISSQDNSSKGNGFTFGFFPDAISVSDGDDILGARPLVNTTTDHNGSTQELSSGAFTIDFATHKGVGIGDRSGSHVGVNWLSRGLSLNTTALTAVAVREPVGGNVTALIKYTYPSRKLTVWISTTCLETDPDVDGPVLELRDFDLSERVLPSMYVGFSGAMGDGIQSEELQTMIRAWTFRTTFDSLDSQDHGPVVVSRSRARFRKLSSSREHKRKETMVAVCLVLVAVVVAGSICVLCFMRWRLRKASQIPFHKFNPSPSGYPPFQDRKLSTPRDSLSSRPLLSSRPSLSSAKPSLSSEPSQLPPRHSLSSKPSFPQNRGSLKSFLEPMRLIPTMEKFKHSWNSSVGSGSRRLTTTQELDALTSIGPRRYTYGELKQATNGFKETLGKGGFGTVYKGYLPNWNPESGGVPVAVKQVAADSEQGEREFLAEVSIISSLRHRNLVQILGWCHERGKLLLLYDFMENGSLDKHLYDTNPGDPVLSWALRYKAVCQVASALTYLHDGAEQKVIHRDIKSSNVLLDAKFNARLGDFGLARMSETSQVADTTVLQGTLGYLAPELVHTGKATTKTDVFSFGTLILEVICGKKPLDCNRRPLLLGDWVWECFEAGRLEDAVDPKLREPEAKGQDDAIADMVRALQVGLMCVHPHTSCRPPIRFVRQMLVGDLALPTLPSQKPTLSFGAGEFLIPMEDLLWRSMTFIASAMEAQHAKDPALKNHKSSAVEFEAPWKLKLSDDDKEDRPGQDSDCSHSFPVV